MKLFRIYLKSSTYAISLINALCVFGIFFIYLYNCLVFTFKSCTQNDLNNFHFFVSRLILTLRKICVVFNTIFTDVYGYVYVFDG